VTVTAIPKAQILKFRGPMQECRMNGVQNCAKSNKSAGNKTI
jgi:hypothetical protein